MEHSEREGQTLKKSQNDSMRTHPDIQTNGRTEDSSIRDASEACGRKETKGHEEAPIAQHDKGRNLVTRPNDRLEPLLFGTVLFGGARSVRNTREHENVVSGSLSQQAGCLEKRDT